MTATSENTARELWQAFDFRRTQPDPTLINRICAFYEAQFPKIGESVAARFVAAKLNFEALCTEHLKQYGMNEVLLAAAKELDSARQAVRDLHAGAEVTGLQLISAAEFCRARAASHNDLYKVSGNHPLLGVAAQPH